MPDYTAIYGRALDLTRVNAPGGYGRDATLKLLNHESTRGYSIIVTVPSGWRAESDTDLPSAVIVEVAESGQVSAANLEATRAVALNGAVFKIEPNLIKRPLGPNKRIWRFYTTPTGEAQV